MSKKREKMSEDRLNAYLDREISDCVGYASGDDIGDERSKNLEYYYNRDRGDEEDGRSKLQDSSVHDVVEAFLPGLLAPFISSDVLCEFAPVSGEDEEQAQQATDAVNHFVMRDNDGVRILYQFAKDGLLQKNGFVYADWYDKEMTRRQQVRTDFAGMQSLTGDESIEILSVSGIDEFGSPMDAALVEGAVADPMQQQPIAFDIDFRRTWKEGRIKICNIPPEYTLVSRTANGNEMPRLIGWMEKTTKSALREEGYDSELVDSVPYSSGMNNTNINQSGETSVREKDQGGSISAQEADPTEESTRPVWRLVCWTKVDVDGDGKAELRKIVRAGGDPMGGVVLLNEEANFPCIETWTPVIMPHQFYGRSIVDNVKSIQDWKTALLRSAMDGVYDSVEPRYKVIDNATYVTDDTWSDLTINIPGHPVRMNHPDGVTRLNDQPDLAPTLQMLEMADSFRETRSPVTRQMQAVDPDILNKTTATQAQIQANASMQRQELILRLFAEGVGRLCMLVYKLAVQHQDTPRMMRLKPNQPPVSIDPRFWDVEMDVSVKVGLGTGTKQQQLQSLMMIQQIQMQDMQMGLPTVDPEKLYNTRARMIEFSGLSMPELYFNDPANVEQQAPQGASPEEVKQAQAQAFEEGKAQGADATKMAEIESKERMHGIDSELKGVELQMRNRENVAQAAGYNV